MYTVPVRLPVYVQQARRNDDEHRHPRYANHASGDNRPRCRNTLNNRVHHGIAIIVKQHCAIAITIAIAITVVFDIVIGVAITNGIFFARAIRLRAGGISHRCMDTVHDGDVL